MPGPIRASAWLEVESLESPNEPASILSLNMLPFQYYPDAKIHTTPEFSVQNLQDVCMHAEGD